VDIPNLESAKPIAHSELRNSNILGQVSCAGFVFWICEIWKRVIASGGPRQSDWLKMDMMIGNLH
jgi:hypothetical protein